MHVVIRSAAPDDFPAMRLVAAEGGSPDGDDRYFGFVAATGTLVVAEVRGMVCGFAGAVPIADLPAEVPADVPADVMMVSDLFVDPAHRARGVGRLLLGAALDGRGRAMTFSSSHPAALRLYASSGLRAGPRLLTMRGVARGGGPPLVPAVWRHARPELVAYMAAAGAAVCEDAVVRLDDDGATVWRATGSEPQRVLDDLLRGLPSGCVVEMSVMEDHRVASWLLAQGLSVIDHDIWCASPGVSIPADVCCVHRGLL